MTVTKQGSTGTENPSAAGELTYINQFSKTPLTEEQVYLFSVRLCDNEVDRDFECFDRTALEQLAGLFVGKTGIFDHSWSAQNQAARLYRTELMEEPGVVTMSGQPGCYLKGYAYMLRTEANEDLIAEIDAGIKKEVSVGCAVQRQVCSICGEDLKDGHCGHCKGSYYNGKLCFGLLQEATDAFEWSFVAVPAQKKAGVIKSLRNPGGETTLRGLLRVLPDRRREAAEEELRELEREAALGRRYLAGLRQETVRLGLMAEKTLDAGVLNTIADKLEEPELLELKRVYEARIDQQFPLVSQLHVPQKAETPASDGAFVI